MRFGRAQFLGLFHRIIDAALVIQQRLFQRGTTRQHVLKGAQQIGQLPGQSGALFRQGVLIDGIGKRGA